MNYDELIDSVLKEVYSRLKEAAYAKDIKTRKTLVVFDEENINEYNRILGYVYEIIPYSIEVESCDAVFISKLCLKGLTSLATLNIEKSEHSFIIEMLMKGKEVYILEEGMEYKRYKNTSPKHLYNKYIDFEKELIKCGMNIVKSISSIGSKNEEATSTVESPILEETSLEIRGRKLITEGVLKKHYMNNMKSMVIDNNTIITPLASDFIKINNLKLKRV